MRRNFLKICQEEMPHLFGASAVKRWLTQEKIAAETVPDTPEADEKTGIATSNSAR
jgi:hypothetical protein